MKTHITHKLKRELVLKINPKKLYPVSYTVMQDGTKVMKPSLLMGADLTENQIVELHLNEEI